MSGSFRCVGRLARLFLLVPVSSVVSLSELVVRDNIALSDEPTECCIVNEESVDDEECPRAEVVETLEGRDTSLSVRFDGVLTSLHLLIVREFAGDKESPKGEGSKLFGES